MLARYFMLCMLFECAKIISNVTISRLYDVLRGVEKERCREKLILQAAKLLERLINQEFDRHHTCGKLYSWF